MFDSCICIDDFERCDVQTLETRRARKPYTCDECRCEIQPGDRYEHWSGLSDGDWLSSRTCLTCSRIRSDLFKCGWLAGEMWTEIHETYCWDDECICPR